MEDDYNHVCNPNFRRLPLYNGASKEERMFAAMDNLCNHPDVVDSFEAQMLLRATYQTTMGIFDHTKDDISPISLMLAHENESTKLSNRRYRRMMQFDEAKLLSVFGVTWSEFQKLPFPEAEMLIHAARERNRINALNQRLGLESTKDTPPF